MTPLTDKTVTNHNLTLLFRPKQMFREEGGEEDNTRKVLGTLDN